MKKVTKLSVFCLSLVMLIISAACSSSNSSNSSSSSSKSPATETSAKQNEKFTISLLTGLWGKVPKSNGPGVQAINEKFNIDYRPQQVPMSEADQKIAVVMASGSIPDVIGLQGVSSNFVKWARQGAFLPLNDYIDKYSEFKLIPKSVWDAVTVDGKIYGIPKYFRTKYMNSAIIRKDWLDKLHLKMPTNYQELLQVCEAFTKMDPDGNNKNDTYGFVTSKGIDWDMRMGVYYNYISWYLKNDKGQYVPGIITDGSKERVQFMHDAYQASYVTKDWPIIDFQGANDLFWQGKAGIYYEGAPGNSKLFDLLKESDPNAVVVPIPPFKAPDGSQGQPGLSGWYMLDALSANLKDNPAKVDRILSMMNYFMKFIPVEERNPSSPDFDWKNGGVGKGYQFTNGVAVFPNDDTSGTYRPSSYYNGVEWAPNDEALHLEQGLTNPIQEAYVKAVIEEWSKPNYIYMDPSYRIHSDLYDTKFGELYNKMIDEETKMILGQEPMSSWDKIVQDFLKSGGQEMINDVNQKIKEVGAEGNWLP